MDLFRFPFSRRSILLSIGFSGVLAAILLSPFGASTEAVRKSDGKGLTKGEKTHEPEIPNYDIRVDKTAFEKLAAFRGTLNRTASDIADRRENLVRGEEELRMKVPTLKVEYNPELRTPEVISPDVAMGRNVLEQATAEKKSRGLKRFLSENKSLIGATPEQVDGLKLFADYKNPDGNLGFVEYTQEINNIPVFRGSVKAAYSKNGEIIRVINNFAPGLDYGSVSTDFGEPEAALQAAARHINHQLLDDDLTLDAARGTELKARFGEGQWSPSAEKIYFPTEPGVAIPAWRVIIVQPLRAYIVIVDAANGELLFRKNATEDQTQAATFEVYANLQAMMNAAKSPAPSAPTIFDPNAGTQGLPIFRTNVNRVGNEGPYSFNNAGWIWDATNVTDGNNVESGLDLGAPNGLDPGTQATGEPYRNFSSAWNPPPVFAGTADDPTSPAARRGAVIQQFYIVNLFHDELYRLGFTEQARNFQANNFGRGGLGSDRISAEAQDFASLNNANFTTLPDGDPGRMQMFVFNAPNPDRDGATDADMMVHELAHGVSNRLIGNADGLWSSMSRAMGEGWSDFYAHSLLSEPNDPPGGAHSLSGYLLLNAFGAVGTQNYYYGIRRFPKAIMSATGGPQNRPYNPMTFADIDQTKMELSNGAYPAMFGAHISPDADQVHAAGEIWSSALWEVRGKLVQRLGWAEGNRRALQFVTDAMKVTPLNPTYLQGRDAIISVALGSATTAAQLQDAADVWSGFAIRGMGVNAVVHFVGTGEGDARVTESFETPNLLQLPSFTISDAAGDNDGIAEPGEQIALTVPLTNLYGQTAVTVTADIPGAGATAYGTILNAASVTRVFNYTVPANMQCGSLINLSLNVNSSLGAKSFTLAVPIGVKSVTMQQNFDVVATPSLPAGWTNATVGAGQPWGTTSSASDSLPNAAYANSTGAAGNSDLTSPAFPVNSSASTVTFKHRFDLEGTWDGAVLEISMNGGPFQDILADGGSFTEGGYNGTIGTNAVSVIAGRQAWTAQSNGFATTTAVLPSSANGQSVQLRWRLASDSNTVAGGWHVDSIVIRATSSCSFTLPPTGVRSRADFDGDGKSDLSIFRPSDGNWWLATSGGVITAMTWGVSTDQPTPGDFDGDGRTDFAIFRPTAGSDSGFYLMQSDGFIIRTVPWGVTGDKPVIGDYDGDGRDDVTIFRPSDNTWYSVKSSGGLDITQYGQAGDTPVPGKFDNDNKTDRAVYRNGQWIVSNSTGGTMLANWGEAGDILVPADYDGDNRDDLAVWRPSNGFWYIRRSTNFNLDIFSWGQTGDVPAPGDFDGDGRDDPAIYRNGTWWIIRSTQGIVSAAWGVAGDVPIPSKYVP